MLIDVTKMNDIKNGGYAYSNKAEAAILNAIDPYATNRYVHIPTDTVWHGDFYRNDNELGDIKISRSNWLNIELAQVKHGEDVSGWYHKYKQIEMKWLMFLNPGWSTMKRKYVWKIRLIEFQTIVKIVEPIIINQTFTGYKITKENSILLQLDPMKTKHIWIGDFEKPTNTTLDTNIFEKAGKITF